MSRAGAIVLLRGAVITVGVTVLVTLALSMLMRLPKEPTLRACALVLPFFAGVAVAGAWYESGAAWPSFQWRIRPRRSQRAAVPMALGAGQRR